VAVVQVISSVSAQGPYIEEQPSGQVFPAPWRGRGAIGLAAETELIYETFLLEKEPEPARCRQAVCQGRGLLVRAGLPEAVQQACRVVRVIEGGVGGGPAGQRRGLLMRARLPQRISTATSPPGTDLIRPKQALELQPRDPETGACEGGLW
jgi:hypothetical protein